MTHGRPPPPCRGTSPAPRACAMLASCLRRACYEGKTTRAPPPPPHTPPPPQGWGMQVGGGEKPPPPPEDKAAGWGGSGERVRDGPHDRARREHAPCKPQRGDHRGCERRVGRVTTGATRHAPPPLERDRCRATCLCRACGVPATCVQRREDDKPPPPPTHLRPPKGGG